MYIPVKEFKFPEPGHEMFTMRCKNHPDLRWSTKNPYQRSLHYLGLARHVEITEENASFGWRECDCKFEDLEVIVEETE
jgi:hypothetical protein